MTDNPEIQSMQDAIWLNRLTTAANTGNVPYEFYLLTVAVDEAFRTWRRGRPELADKLADVTMRLLGVAGMTGSDLQTAVTTKLAAITSTSDAALVEAIR